MKRLILTCMCVVTMFMCVSVARAVTTGSFDAEIVSLNLSGNVGGMYVEVHESSTPSMGELTLSDIGGGLYHIDSFFDVFTELSVDDGPFEPLNGSANTIVLEPLPMEEVTLGTFATEIVSMSLSGMYAGTPVEVRQSPIFESLGGATITNIGGGLYHIDSFFDVFTELSVDGGATFMPGLEGSVHTYSIVPEPTSMALLMWIGLMALLGGRKLVYQRGRRAL